MASYVAMLNTDPDDQYLTESVLEETRQAVSLRFFADLDQMDAYAREHGKPVVILLNDQGSITGRGQALRTIRSNDAYKHIPTVVLGEKSSPDYIKECYRAGASSFITKPSTVSSTKKKIAVFFEYWLDVAETVDG